jgi:uncharacterized protein YfaS (alpha-2-macroglobulin family)
MPSLTCKVLKCLLVVCLLFSFKPASAQTNYHNIIFTVDSLAEVGLPKSALVEINKLDQLAHRENNAPQMVKAVIYRLKFQSYLKEDALVSVIDTLKADIGRSDFPVKPVLQSLLAGMYWKYYEQNRYQFANRTRQQVPDSDFRKWDLATIIDEVSSLYKLSLNDAAREQETPVGIFDKILIGDETTRVLRPSLYDLLLHRAFDYFLADEAAVTTPKTPFSVNDERFFGDSKAFAAISIKTNDTASTQYLGLKYLQQATASHLQKNNRRALADLDLKRLNFLYDKATLKNKGDLYLKSLQSIAADADAGIIAADALYAIGSYYKAQDSLTMALPYLQKAIALYPKSTGAQNAHNLLNDITIKILTIGTENLNAPGVPILARLTYRNIKAARYKVYDLNDAQLARIKKMDEDYNSGNPLKKTLAYLKTLSPIQGATLQLPVATDLREHITEFKIDPLKVGNYLILASQVGVNDSLNQVLTFKVTGLAYTTRTRPDQRREIRVSNRETGEPVAGAALSITLFPDNYSNEKKLPVVVKGLSDANGSFMFTGPGTRYSVDIRYHGDVLTDDNRYGYASPVVQNREPIYKTLLFTDRQIYRPGQIIYFKALQIQSLNGQSSIVPNTDLNVNIHDQNNKELGNIKLVTNDFGSTGSSFIIPQNVLNGWLRLITSNGGISVKVEEYKRPTFKVTFEPVTQNYKLNDSVTLKGKVTAFSGYGLSDARVALHITRAVDIRALFNGGYNRQKGYISQRYSKPAEILTDTINTDRQGNFLVKFKAASPDEQDDDVSYRFSVGATVTDAASETQSAATEIALSNKQIQLQVMIPDKMFAGKNGVATVDINNFNSQKQAGSAQVQVYVLAGPGRFFKARLWDAPDKWLMSKNEYEQYFSSFAYNHEDDYEKWQRANKVADLTIDIKNSGRNELDLNKLLKNTSGVYAVVISAKSLQGDTASVTRYVNYIADEVPVQKNADWVLPVSTAVKPGAAAEFYVGVGQNCKVWLETYDEDKILNTQRLTLKAGAPQKITIPVVTTLRNSFSVQFTLINGNRSYSYYQRIVVEDTTRQLNIRFLTMRDKLQPGDKEEWKLQIDGSNEKQTSELLAGLYDASLDDVSAPLSWQQDFTAIPYLPQYFEWRNEVPSTILNSNGEEDNRPFYDGRFHLYESINMFGFDAGDANGSYGYQQYQQNVVSGANAISGKKAKAQYTSNAKQVKSGYDVVGKVEWNGSAVDWATVKIEGTSISAQTDARGYFRIKVPFNSVLLVSGKTFVTRRVKLEKGRKIIIRMQTTDEILNTAREAQGLPVTDIRIDEPVGNSDIKQVVEENSNGIYSYNAFAYGYSGKAKGAPVAMMYDEIYDPNIVLREIPTRPGQKFDKELLPRSAREVGTAPVTIRKNFSETAFFYPQLQTDAKGQVTVAFTIPESLTRWKFRGLAHNRDLQVGYIEQEVITQKQMMISANMPRFLREGDTLTVSARVVNLSHGKLNGKARLELFNGLNMQPVNLYIKGKDQEQSFGLDSSSTGAVAFKIVVPSGLEALTYRVTASAGNYTDGEENTLPVLPNSMLVTETMPMMVRAGQTKTFNFDKLVNQSSNTLKSKTLTLEYTQNPAWAAIQSLPYLMEFPYECSEQIFSRYYANSFALNIVNQYPQIKQVFERWKNGDAQALISNLEKNPELKSVLLEETPWLQEAISETEQKKRIALLFDLNKATYELDQNITKLYKKQLLNGGFPWFGGDNADRYITQHVLAGIGELYQLKIVDRDVPTPKMISAAALRYVDKQLKDDELNARKVDKKYLARNLTDIEVHAWYARSFFTDVKMNGELSTVKKNFINRAIGQWVGLSVFDKAMIALTLYRFGEKETTAMIIKSLLETAQQSDELGMYWADNRPGYYWYQSPVETQSMMISLFTEATGNTKAVDEMKVWLLTNKQTNNWRTTKATAAACYALLIKGNDVLTDAGKTTITVNGNALANLKPDIKAEAGTGYIKTSWTNNDIKPGLGHVEVSNSSKTINWGAMYWQYTERLDKITPSNTNVQLERKYFILKETDKGPVLTAVDASHQPKTGDVLKVVVYLKADRDFDYIHLKDLRPAGTEPMGDLSGYKHQEGLYYYQVSKDVATNFFISQLYKGSYVFEYQLRVVQPGNYATGITSLQSMYAPEFNAHSNGGRIGFTE